MADRKPGIAVIGGSGDLGSGLALRWARAGYPVIIGSRTEEKAVAAAENIRERIPGAEASGMENSAAAAAGEIVVMTVPFSNHRPTLEAVRDAVQGKIFVDVTVPLVPPKVSRVQMPPEGSAGKLAQEILGPEVQVVSAFQNVAADHLADLEHDPDCDVLVAGNAVAAREQVIELVEACGMKGWHVGPIDNAAVAEALTSVLIFMNKRYKSPGAGIRITNIPGAD
ncbi:NADPH-dependent F420 reductase [Minwuia thermotolerans]|uniref:NADPH-dependent F420 reductase n=1 Tax=Minwuia thermotolerans TaxID=2056226 RepID=A0A2M9G1L4_9PROT|nr:NADPH-dependent F420 reductase [Minwuia thermotolerans]PJK29596.1 NADPH-dependent F420 reductase [Minwuia thermotolerans]